MRDTILTGFRRKLPRATLKKLPREVRVVGVGLRESYNLNRRFFKKSRSANVLSFRYGPDYGEILLCPKIIRREAKEQGNTYKYQFAWMILHGMLHLAGMHHERSKQEARRVEKMEEQVLKRLFVH